MQNIIDITLCNYIITHYKSLNTIYILFYYHNDYSIGFDFMHFKV